MYELQCKKRALSKKGALAFSLLPFMQPNRNGKIFYKGKYSLLGPFQQGILLDLTEGDQWFSQSPISMWQNSLEHPWPFALHPTHSFDRWWETCSGTHFSNRCISSLKRPQALKILFSFLSTQTDAKQAWIGPVTRSELRRWGDGRMGMSARQVTKVLVRFFNQFSCNKADFF